MWTMVVIVFSLVGVAWFDKTRDSFIALAPSQTSDPKTLTVGANLPPSPFASIRNSISDFQARISGILWNDHGSYNVPTPPPVSPQILPIK